MTTGASIGVRLPFLFDKKRLQRDLDLIDAEEWRPHYSERDFGGLWKGVALRSATGSPTDILAGPAGLSTFRNTPLLERCVYLADLLKTFQCPLKSVRLLSLAPGSFIREHTDDALAFEEGEVRLHIPIRTNPGVEFYVCGERLSLEEGQCYYVNVNLPHRVNNRGAFDRVHLVIDSEVNAWLRAAFTNVCEIPRSRLPPAGFDAFARLVFEDVALREKLRAIPTRYELIQTVVSEADRRGMDLNEADVEAVFRSQAQAGSLDADGWVPIRAAIRGSQVICTWIYAPGRPFTEPFFEESIRICLRAPFVKLFQREMPLRAGRCVTRPTGFIFHMSRCGSTLISRSLAAAESVFVLSEPKPIDEVVQAIAAAENQPSEWLGWIVSALCQSGCHCVIKLDSWHIRSLPLFRAVFPEVPWVFIYRDPAEIIVSQLRQPGLHASPGAMDPSILGLRFEDVTALTQLEWCSHVLAGFMRAALAFRDDPKGMFVDYDELPAAICGRIAAHFALQLSPVELVTIESATMLDAKNPSTPFVSDQNQKRLNVGSLPPNPLLSTLSGLYEELSSCERTLPAFPA